MVRWLMYNGVSNTQKGIAKKLGYNDAVLSQILNGKVPMSMKFIDKLCSMNKFLNKQWLIKGTGNMLDDEIDDYSENVVLDEAQENINKDVLVRILENQTKVIDRLTIQMEALMMSVRKQQEQIEYLEGELKKKG